MQGKWKKYDNQTYYKPDGSEYTIDMMHEDYPVSIVEDMAIKVVGMTILEIETMLCVRAEYGIDPEVSDEEALQQMEVIDAERATESTPLERIAASLEYLCMMYSQRE